MSRYDTLHHGAPTDAAAILEATRGGSLADMEVRLAVINALNRIKLLEKAACPAAPKPLAR